MTPEDMNIDVSQLRTYNYILSVEKRLSTARVNFMDFLLSFSFRFLLAVSSTFFVLGLAIFLFFLIQYSMLPEMHQIFPVNLQHPDCEKCKVEVCVYPNATIPFIADESSNPPSYGLLMAGQVYSFSVLMELPESEVNMDAGIFMVELTLRSVDEVVIQSSARAASMRYHSFVHHVLRLLILWPFYLASWMEERQQIRLEVLPYHKESHYQPVVDAIVTIHRSRLDIYQMELHVEAKVSGFRFYLQRYPLIIGLFMVFVNFLFGMTVVSLVVYNRLQKIEELTGIKWKRNESATMENEGVDQTDEESEDPEEVDTEIEDDFFVPDTFDPVETTSCESKDF